VKGIVYYTHNRLDERIMKACQWQLERACLPIVAVSLKPLAFGDNVVLDLEPGYLTMFKQILAGVEKSHARVVFFAEHDVLYHPSHFEFAPVRDDVFYYNVNVWKVRIEDGHALKVDDCKQTSGLCAHRSLLLEHYRERVRRVEVEGFTRRMGFEPGTHGRAERVDDYKAGSWSSDYPNIDLRHGGNLTASRWRKEQFRNRRYTRGWTEGHVTELWNGTVPLPKL
jgi:hypothetical protein